MKMHWIQSLNYMSKNQNDVKTELEGEKKINIIYD